MTNADKNALIAKAIGWEPAHYAGVSYEAYQVPVEGIGQYESGACISKEQLQFHDSWDWLNWVYENHIDKMFLVNISKIEQGHFVDWILPEQRNEIYIGTSFCESRFDAMLSALWLWAKLKDSE